VAVVHSCALVVAGAGAHPRGELLRRRNRLALATTSESGAETGRQPKPPRKEHQEKCHSFLPFSFSPCSLIKGTTGGSRMLARRADQTVEQPLLLYCCFDLAAPLRATPAERK
jgi:hypothetical protein